MRYFAAGCLLAIGYSSAANAQTFANPITFVETSDAPNRQPDRQFVGIIGAGYSSITGSLTGRCEQIAGAGIGCNIDGAGLDPQDNYSFAFGLAVPGIEALSVQALTLSAPQGFTFRLIGYNGDAQTFDLGPLGASGGYRAGGGGTNNLSIFASSAQATGTFSLNYRINITAQPEPSTWATFILGFGFIGFATRRGRTRKLLIG